MAGILASHPMQTVDDLSGGPQGNPRTEQLIDASMQWAERIMQKVDEVLRTWKKAAVLFPPGTAVFLGFPVEQISLPSGL